MAPGEGTSETIFVPCETQSQAEHAAWLNPRASRRDREQNRIPKSLGPSIYFTHEPLDLGEPLRAIRLVDILPLQSDGVLQCELHQVSLANASPRSVAPTYSAISYEWGTANPAILLINGSYICIRENLYFLLVSLLEQHGNRPVRNLWIDALCIDQTNLPERNIQVRQMKRIYQDAQQVIVWLGLADKQSDELFDYMNSPSVLSEMIPEHISPAFESICSRSYWGRQWIIQEVVCARDVLLLCGLKQCTWAPWRHLMHSAPEHLATTLPGRLVGLRDEGTVFLQHSAHGNRSLADLMVAFAQSECAMTQDKAFSLVGLAGGETVLEVDYNAPLYQLLLNVLKITPSRWSLRRLQLLFKIFDWPHFESTNLRRLEGNRELPRLRSPLASHGRGTPRMLWRFAGDRLHDLHSPAGGANWCNKWYQGGLREWCQSLGFEEGDGLFKTQSCKCSPCVEGRNPLIRSGEDAYGEIGVEEEVTMSSTYGRPLQTRDEIIHEILPGEVACLYTSLGARGAKKYLGTVILSKNPVSEPSTIYNDPGLSHGAVKTGSKIPNMAQLVNLMAHFERIDYNWPAYWEGIA